MWYRWYSVVPGSRRLVNSANHLLVWGCTVNMDVVRETFYALRINCTSTLTFCQTEVG